MEDIQLGSVIIFTKLAGGSGAAIFHVGVVSVDFQDLTIPPLQ